jgi:hypothetical protein
MNKLALAVMIGEGGGEVGLFHGWDTTILTEISRDFPQSLQEMLATTTPRSFPIHSAAHCRTVNFELLTAFLNKLRAQIKRISNNDY